jgi:hypothetical protein
LKGIRRINITNGYEENGANDIYTLKIIAHEFSQKKNMIAHE